MALPLLLSATKFLGGAISKAKSPNAKNTATVDKGGEGGGGKPGAIVKSETTSVTPTSPMVGSGVVSTSTTPPKVSKPTGKVSFSSISNQLDSIVSLTSMIDTVTQKNTEGQKRASELVRKSKEKQKKKDREEKSESGGALGFLGSKAKEVGNKFGIFNFFTSILLGIGALALIDLTKKLSKGFDGLGDVFGGITQGFKLFGLTIAAVAKEFPTLLTKGKNLLSQAKLGDKLKKLGTGFKSVFKSLGTKLIPGYIKKTVDVVKNTLTATRNFGRIGLEFARRVLTLDTRTKLPGATNKGLNKLLNNVGKGSGGGVSRGIGEGFRRLPGSSGRTNINTLSKDVLSIRAKHGDEAARMYQGLVDMGQKPQRALQNVNKAISSGKLTSVPMQGNLGGAIKRSQIVKGGIKRTLKRTSIKFLGKGVTKFLGRIPVIGSLLVGIFSLLEDLDGDGNPDMNFGRAAIISIGAGLGGAIGTGIMPVVGTVIGELIGEYIGKLFYTAISGGGLEGIKKQLGDDIKAAFISGQVALGWIGDGFKRFYEGIPKLTVPWWIQKPLKFLTGVDLKEIPDLGWLYPMNPISLIPKVKVMSKAFFSRDPMMSGAVTEAVTEPEKVEIKDQGELTNASGQTGSMSEQAKQIAEGKYYESSGMYYNSVTHEYVGATEEEARAKLGVSVSQAQIAGSAVSRAGQTTGTQRGDMISGFPVRSPYGPRDHPVTGERDKPHGGIDIATPVGTFVALSVPVEIMYAAPHGGYGYVIDAWAPSLGLQFRLAHLKEFLVRKGQKVPAGTALGKTGGAKGDRGAGMSTGPHLHFEVDNIKNGTKYGGLGDPSPYVQYLILSSNNLTKSTSTMDLKPTKPEPKREDFGSGRSGAKKYAEALKAYKSEMQSQPEISPQTSPSASVSGVESQASYEQTGGGSTVVLAAPQQQSSGGGGGSSGGGGVMRVGSGDVLNSYYRAQLLGFLYKQG